MAQAGPATKGISEPSYAVYRPSEDEAGPSYASNTNLEEDDNERPNTPPPYSGPTTLSMIAPPSLPLQQQTRYHPGLPKLNYQFYSPPNFTLSQDKITITSHDPRLSIYPAALISLINGLSTLPPKPIVQIRGVNSNTLTVDFDIKINLMNLIIPDDDPKRRMNYVRLIGPGEKGFRGDIKETMGPNVEGGLQEWARLYCEDRSSLKQFTFSRTIPNFDTSYLQGRLLSLISSTSYPGQTTITFPVTHSKAIIHSPHKVNSFFSSVTKVFTGTKKYEIVKAVWPYANVTKGEQGRKCVVQDEEEWFLAWKDLIKYAVLGKRKGWVTVEDRLEFLMEPMGEEKKEEVWRN